jgi:FtsZ-binding cell division protein ZapB
LKKNVSAFTQGLDVLTKVKPVWFQYNGEADMPTNKTYVGVIAQEMQKIAPYMVGSFTYQDTTGKKADYLDYDANALTYILVNAVKEQQGQMEQLKQENETRMQEIQERDAQMEALKQENEQMKKEMAEIRAWLLDKKAVTESDAAARLWQNEPNPTDGTTLIRYRIPRQAGQAQINLYSLKGEQLKSFSIRERGEGQLSLDTTTLPEGIYLYRLIIDGKPIDAKKLLLNR